MEQPGTSAAGEPTVKTPLQRFGRFFVIYWKALFVIIYPLALLPVFLWNNIAAYRCLYVVLVMAGFWVFEVLPLAVTSLIPMVLFPLMGILDSDKTSLNYMKETNMMFIGGLIIAIAIEECNLHTRVALNVIKVVGCSPRRLNIGLCAVTMFVSMWISNTAACAMMIPIVDATLTALEEQGIGEMYEQKLGEKVEDDDRDKKPTKTTMCYYISTAYAASIGGTGCVIGSGTNLSMKGLYENLFPNSPGVEFTKWMALNVPIMLLVMFFTVIWLQFWFMGLFRPKSKDAKKIDIGKEGELVARTLIKKKLNEMGKMSFHEIMVGLMFILAIMLWFFRKPQFIPGWAERLTKLKVKDATAALIVCMLLFTLPSHLGFLYVCSKDESKVPKKAAPPLVTWKVVQKKMPWGLILLLGAGFAMAEASKASGMSQMVADRLAALYTWDKYYVMMVAGLMGAVLTQFSSNVAIANIILPVLATISQKARLHPMYLMMPATLCCSYAYCLPVSTPPNAIAAAPCNMPSIEMVKVGLGVTVISVAICFAIFPFYGALIWDFSSFPSWAELANLTTTTLPSCTNSTF